MPGRILMIDDDREYIELIDAALVERGCVASYAENGSDGVRLALLLQPDLILLDIQMPRMDGFDVAAVLRREPELRNTRILAVTGMTESDPERLAAAGFDGFFPKPVDPAMFVNEIERFLPEPLSKRPADE